MKIEHGAALTALAPREVAPAAWIRALSAWFERIGAVLGGKNQRLILNELRLLQRELRALRSELDTDSARLKACPICLRHFRQFEPLKGRAQARCPSCGSLERHRLSWLYLKQHTALFHEPTRLLHVAPEPGMRACLERNFNVAYTATSYDPERPDEGIDLQRLPFADGSFDLIYCCHVLEHVPDDRRALRELARVLRPGGRAVILVPTRNRAATYEDERITAPEERARHFGRHDHLRWYGRDLLNRLAEAGFTVKVVYHHETLSIDELNRYGIAAEPIFDCTRV